MQLKWERVIQKKPRKRYTKRKYILLPLIIVITVGTVFLPFEPVTGADSRPPEKLTWNVDVINAEVVWGGHEKAEDVSPYYGCYAGQGVKVAVLDSGIDHTHLDLDGNFRGGINIVDSNNNNSNTEDTNGHGTMCAGVLAAEDDGYGVIGVAPKVELYAIKGAAHYAGNFYLGVEWAVNNGIDVISASIGHNSDNTGYLKKAADLAEANGIVMVAAAGNNGQENIDYPAGYPSVISVGAVDMNLQRLDCSDFGEELDLVAPGDTIETTEIGGGYTYSGATSMATPHVAGVVALMLSKNPTLTPHRIRQILAQTAGNLGEPGWDQYYGHGLVQADAAVAATPVGYSPATYYDGYTHYQGSYSKYVNGYTVATPYGAGYHVDTAGSSDYGYHFFAHETISVFAGRGGEIHVKGYFRQYDTFSSDLQPGRRFLKYYLLTEDGLYIIRTGDVLTHADGTGWVPRSFSIEGLVEGQFYKLAFGRADGWLADWELTAEWAGIEVHPYRLRYEPATYVYDSTTQKYVMSPRSVNGWELFNSYGKGYHVDTSGSSGYGYHFLAFQETIVFADSSGKINGQGHFRQYDTFSSSLQPGRRYLNMYLLTVDGFEIAKTLGGTLAVDEVLDHTCGTSWHVAKFSITGLVPRQGYRLAFGRADSWLTDWKLTAEWIGITVFTSLV